MTRPQKFAHGVAEGVDLTLAIALELPITASCGLTFVPRLEGDALGRRPQCPTCFPPSRASRRGPRFKDTKDHPHYVYRCFDRDGRLIYVGCTNNPVNRLKAHRSGAWWRDDLDSVRLVVFPNRPYALAKEREAIATEKPRWNVKGKWPYREDWSAQDYIDFRHAVVQSVETSHGVYGRTTRQLIEGCDLALADLGVRTLAGRPA